MDVNSLAIYIHELRNQAHYAEGSFGLFNQSLQEGNTLGALYSAQNILFAASQISCLLWPSRARNRGRGEGLRSSLKLPEKHALNDRRLSELWEHSDQKTEDWINATKGKKIIFDLIMPLSQIPEADRPEDDCLYRAYDPDTKLFYFRGIAYNMSAIANSISDVGGRIVAAHRQLFPEQAAAEQKAIEEAQAAAAAQANAAQSAEMPVAAPIDITGDMPAQEVEEVKKAPKKAAKKPAKKTEKKPAKKPAKKTVKKAAKK